ncbi:topoisomerase I binding, arginine/serine-rich a isoform X3 [Osmerus eperlanus]|uniref:topoisomerase I binding, arginine/serine-rich a isoform X3 n=1 Tax=Osmerus eperlanus TaxID=29151 RepID=UPI002E0E61B9
MKRSMATAKTSLRQRQKSSTAAGKLLEVMSGEASPDSKCPICLDCFNNISYLDLCLHKFCFRCIHEWSKNKAECPLCKQPFNSIYHTIKSETDFKKYDLRPSENGSFGNFGGERFRYRTTLTGARRQAQRRTSPPPDNGVMFEGVVTGSAHAREDRRLRRFVVRLAARRRAEREGREVRALQEQEMVRFRRALYRRGIKVRSVRDGGRSRDTSADFYQRNPACLHRLVPWLKRELVVLYGAHGSLVNIVQHIIMSRITRYDMEDGAIQEELRPFLQARTEHFLHEFISFARAPFNMEAYDQHAVYDCPAPSSDDDDGDSTDSSVIAISEDGDGGERGGSVELDPPADSMSSGALSQTAWDDETPGPSYSTAPEAGRAPPLAVLDSESDSSPEEEGGCGGGATRKSLHIQIDPSVFEADVGGGRRGDGGVWGGGGAVSTQKSLRVQIDSSLLKGDRSSGGGGGGGGGDCASDEDCVIVGFVKPISERTPELVKLSSDSEESVLEEEEKEQEEKEQEEKEEKEKKEKARLPQHIRFSSLSPPSTPPGHAPRLVGRDLCGSRDARDGSSLSGSRHGSSGKSDSRHRSRERSRERGERRRTTRSPASRGKRPSHSPSRDRDPRFRHGERSRKGDKDGGRSGHDPGDGASHPLPYQRERDERGGGGGVFYIDRKSHYSSSSHRDLERHSRSRSGSRSRESRRRRRSSTRSCSSSAPSPSSSRKSRHEKPGGKRKYKTRHLEDFPAKETPSTKSSYPEPDSSSSAVKDRKGREKRWKRAKEKARKRSRSLSVEIVYEGSPPVEEHTKRHHKKKKKHKKKSRKHRNRERTDKPSPTIITIDSDSDHAYQSCIPSGDAPPIKTTVTGNPADSSLLESMLQNWEKLISPLTSENEDLKPECPLTVKASDNSTLEHSDNVPKDDKPQSALEDDGKHLFALFDSW